MSREANVVLITDIDIALASRLPGREYCRMSFPHWTVAGPRYSGVGCNQAE